MSIPLKDSTVRSRAPEFLARVELGGVFGPVGPNTTVLFVDSNHANGSTQDDTDGFYGRTRAFPTLKEALDRLNDTSYHRTTFNHSLPMATDALIVLCEGHSESVTTAGGIDLTKNGTRVVGLGSGTRRPKLLIDAVAATVEVSAANCWIEGVDIVASITGITSNFLNLDASALNTSLVDCRFYADAAHAAMPTGGPITVNASATFANLRGNYFEWVNGARELIAFPDGLDAKSTIYNFSPQQITMVVGTTGAATTHETLTVTGNIKFALRVQCVTTGIAGAGTLDFGDAAVGTSINTQLADAEDLDPGDFWVTTTAVGTQSEIVEKLVGNGNDLGYTVGSTALTAGILDFQQFWAPLDSASYAVSADGTGTL